jgi:hypothetical protein
MVSDGVRGFEGAFTMAKTVVVLLTSLATTSNDCCVGRPSPVIAMTGSAPSRQR